MALAEKGHGVSAEDEVAGSSSIPSTPEDSMDRDGAMHDNQHIKLGWKTWLVVFITCFG